MAVNIKPKAANAESDLLALGKVLDLLHLATPLKNAGCELVVEPKYSVIYKDGAKVAEHNMNANVIPLLLQGQVAPTSLGVMKTKMSDFLTKALNTLGLSPDPSASAASPDALTPVSLDPPPAKKAKLSQLAVPVENIADPEVVALPEEVSNYAEDLAAPVVPLIEADMFHQPVKGSSGGSRYFLVARSEGLSIAARLTSDGEGFKVSLRAEGSKLDTQMKRLATVGFKRAAGADYASMHVNHSQLGVHGALRTLGALVMGCGVPMSYATHNERIWNKGA